MAIAESVRNRTRTNPRAVTAVLSLVGYALVAAAFAGALPLPRPGDATVLLLGDLIAVINTVALTALLLGWWFIRRGDVENHRQAMLSAFALILLFLVLYVYKQVGFTKGFVGPPAVEAVYLAMLAVHVLLSVVAVPVVLHAVVLGLTHTPAELRETVHPRVGRVAVAAWATSLALGILTYLLLNHVYAWEKVEAAALLAFAATRPPDHQSVRPPDRQP